MHLFPFFSSTKKYWFDYEAINKTDGTIARLENDEPAIFTIEMPKTRSVLYENLDEGGGSQVRNAKTLSDGYVVTH